MRGGHGGCDRRIEVFVKIQKKKRGGGGSLEGGGDRVGGGGVRVDVNEELWVFFLKIKKKMGWGGKGGVVSGGGGGCWGGQGGCE